MMSLLISVERILFSVFSRRCALFERALSYHDSSAVAYFGDQLSNVETQLFCGNEYRTNEVSSAILRAQMRRLGGILADLRQNKKGLWMQLPLPQSLFPQTILRGTAAQPSLCVLIQRKKPLLLPPHPV